jgi:hypothetical protein
MYLCGILIFVQVFTCTNSLFLETNENKISSDFITIENAWQNKNKNNNNHINNSSKFNLLQTLSFYEDQAYLDCQLIDRFNYKINIPKISNKFVFSNRTYYFMNFSDLESGHDYHFFCNKWDWLVDKNLKFPKEKNVTNLLSFGDWSEGELGSQSKNIILSSFINQIDSILYLGDLAYDLDDDNGERGNSFLTFIKDITSVVPFQVNYR